MKKVLIIGGGLAGLTAGTFLTKNGYDVTIYEKNNTLGGFVTSWTRKNQLIDGCLHWLMGTSPKGQLNAIYQELNAFKNDDVIRLESFFKVNYEGETLTFYNDIDKLEKELLRVSKEDEKEITRLIDAIKVFGIYELDTSCPKELKEDVVPGGAPDRDFLRKSIFYMNNTIEQVAEKFNSPIIKYALLNIPVDKKFIGLYLIETLSNLVYGNAGLPKGGSKTFINNIIDNYVSNGGKYFVNNEVEKIIVKDNTATGIQLKDNTIVNADYVIAGCDIHHTYEKLLDNKFDFEPYAEMDKDKEKFITYSFNIISFKTKTDLSSKQNTEIYKVSPYTIGNTTYDSFFVRHYAYDETLKTYGYSTIEILIPTYESDYDFVKSLSKQEYQDYKNTLADICLSKFEEVGYLKREELELIDVATPLTLERYMNSYKGSFMTYIFVPKVNMDLHSNIVKDVKNLYLANQWLMMPGGTPIALVRGKVAAQLIMANGKKD